MEQKNIIQALVKAQKEFKSIPKNGRNTTYNREKGGLPYAKLDDILNTVIPVLSKNDLALSFDVQEEYLVARLFHVTGEALESKFPMSPKDRTMQGIAGARTYASRYAVSNLLALACDEDDDGNSASFIDDVQEKNLKVLIGDEKEEKRMLAVYSRINPNIKTFRDVPKTEYELLIAKIKAKKEMQQALCHE